MTLCANSFRPIPIPRILVLAERPVLPAIDGARLRIASLLRGLSDCRVDYVHFVAPGEKFIPVEADLPHCQTLASVEHLGAVTNWSRVRSILSGHTHGSLRNRSARMCQTLCKLSAAKYSVVLVCGLDMVQYLDQLTPTRVVVDICDSEPRHMEVRREFVRDPVRKLYFSWQRVKALREIRTAAPHVQSWIVISELEKRSLNTYFPLLRVQVVPNSIQIPSMKICQHTASLVMTGNFDFYPNIDAASYFVTQVMPLLSQKLPSCRLRVVGKNPPASLLSLRSKVVEFTGFVDNISEAIRDAAVYVCPLRVGTGVKNKVLEAMAVGLPIVSTSIGLEGIGGKDGMHYLEADTPAAFVDAIVRIMESPGLGNDLGKAARELVVRNFSSDVVREALRTAIYNWSLA